MKIRKLTEHDYKTLEKWWKAWNWPPVEKEFSSLANHATNEANSSTLANLFLGILDTCHQLVYHLLLAFV